MWTNKACSFPSLCYCRTWAGYSSQFEIRSQNNFGYPYDKHSIMQYRNTAFGKKQSDGTKATTMESRSDPSESLGAVSHMDANDLEKINAYYECSNAPSCKLRCTKAVSLHIYIRAKLSIRPALVSGFCTMKRLGVFLLPHPSPRMGC